MADRERKGEKGLRVSEVFCRLIGSGISRRRRVYGIFDGFARSFCMKRWSMNEIRSEVQMKRDHKLVKKMCICVYGCFYKTWNKMTKG